jgi:hypothetical protein
MEKYVYYLLKKYIDAGDAGIKFSYLRDVITKEPNYLSLWDARTRDITHSHLIDHNKYLEAIADMPEQTDRITQSGIIATAGSNCSCSRCQI